MCYDVGNRKEASFMAKKQHDDMKGFFDKIEQEHIQVMNTCRKLSPSRQNRQEKG